MSNTRKARSRTSITERLIARFKASDDNERPHRVRTFVRLSLIFAVVALTLLALVYIVGLLSGIFAVIATGDPRNSNVFWTGLQLGSLAAALWSICTSRNLDMSVRVLLFIVFISLMIYAIGWHTD